MVLTINPKVTVVGYGPLTVSQDKQNTTPDEFVWGASRITYKDIGTIEELRQAKAEEKDISAAVQKSLMKSAGSGHASMATTPGMWIMLEGNCSKMVDSAFTGYRFASSLMPSGRRIPIAIEQIVAPQSISEKKETLDLYMQVSEANIQAYELLQERGVPKEEAAKIVQYGHKGGGFMFMPLETIIGIVRDTKRHPGEYPSEIREIAQQFEDFAREHGMKIVYEARMSSPRANSVNPNIFHSQVNEAQLAVDNNEQGVLYHPILQELNSRGGPELEARLNDWQEKRKRVFSSQDRIIAEGTELVHELHDIVSGFNNSLHAVIAANIPWRVWGEDKRHRTMPLTTESVYHAAQRATNLIEELKLNARDAELFPVSMSIEPLLQKYQEVVSIPRQISENPENYPLWLNRFSESITAFNTLIKMGIPKGDALSVVPRGLKLGVSETFDLYNLITGHNSLRLCNTAEREKRELTEAYRDLIAKNVPEYIEKLMVPKCHYVGFCFEEKPCGRINKAVPGYNTEMHKAIRDARFAQIEARLK